MDALREELRQLTERAKTARNISEAVQAADTMAAVALATDLAQIGQAFTILAVKLRQAGREAADAEAAARPMWTPPKLNAAKAARQMERQGAYRVTA